MRLPFSSPSASSAASQSVSTTSGVMPMRRALRASATALSARDTASACLALVSSSPAGVSPAGYSAATASASVSSPAPVWAEMLSTLSNRSASRPTSSRRDRSLLFTSTSRLGTFCAAAMACSSSSVSSCEPSSTSSASYARCAA